MDRNLLITNRHFQDINPRVHGIGDCESGYSFGPASREYFLIHYVFSGKGFFVRQDKKYSLSKGWMFLIRPHEITYYEADRQEPWRYIWIGFDGQKAEQLIDSIFFDVTRDIFYAPQLEYIFTGMWEAQDMHDCCEAFLCSKIYELIAKLYIQTGVEHQKTTSSVYITRAKDYMHANYSGPISIESISKTLGIDRRYFCRIFKFHTNSTPQEYLINLRLDKAAQLLTQYNFTPGDAARSVGYQDIFNFSKMFKKKFGVSPLNYKKLI